MSTGLGLNWIRTIENFVEFGLDPDCKSLQNFVSGPGLDWVNGKGMLHFCCDKAAFLKFFGPHLDFDLTFVNFLDCGWTEF